MQTRLDLHRPKQRGLFVMLVMLVALCQAPASAADPASVAPQNALRQAERSFARFSRDWIQDLQTREEQSRARPSVQPGPETPIVTYRGYAEDFRIELRPTGQSAAPYIGLLHYTENLYSCTDLAALRCQVAASTPLTEIFRFREGHWSY
ncbi:MAG: hypothetical protein OEM49_08135 [Myxococcales bacterium]|nr:hypothetical protein [Myxococcales bacterium]MDH5306472.1 hypothetical protein [Myxococcales bacterium]MDH5565916.1 hypothetical protein [Myxococcales bacterium]